MVTLTIIVLPLVFSFLTMAYVVLRPHEEQPLTAEGMAAYDISEARKWLDKAERALDVRD